MAFSSQLMNVGSEDVKPLSFQKESRTLVSLFLFKNIFVKSNDECAKNEEDGNNNFTKKKINLDMPKYFIVTTK